MRAHRFCKHCSMQVKKETKLDYPFYCPRCDENLYRFETLSEREIKKRSEEKKSVISEGIVRLYFHNIEWWLYGTGHELSETDEEHICAMLANNCYAGELCSTTPDGGEIYGWWKIQNSALEI